MFAGCMVSEFGFLILMELRKQQQPPHAKTETLFEKRLVWRQPSAIYIYINEGEVT